MNKIFKVVWSKVRNAYVVVSEIAKNTVSGVGKRNRIGKVSLAATLAASVLTGGFFMPNEVWAAESAMVDAQKSHYIAIGYANTGTNPFTGIQGVTASGPVYSNGKHQITVTFNTGDNDPNNDESFVYTYTTVNYKVPRKNNSGGYVTDWKGDIVYDDKTANYWIREGFGVKAVVGAYHDEASDVRLDLYKIPGQQASYDYIAMTGEHAAEITSHYTAVNNENLDNLVYRQYAAITNTDGTGTLTSYDYYVKRVAANGRESYDNVGGSKINNNFYYFKETEYNEKTGKYTFAGQDVDYDNVYKIGDKIGVFLTGSYTGAYTSERLLSGTIANSGIGVYGGTVYGKNNEILLSGYDSKNDNWTTVWAGEITDPNATIESMTLSEFNEILHHIHEEDVKLANTGIVSTKVTSGKDTQINTTLGAGNNVTMGSEIDLGLGAGKTKTITSAGSINMVNVAGKQVPGLYVVSSGGTKGNGDDTVITFMDSGAVTSVDANGNITTTQGERSKLTLKTGSVVVANAGATYVEDQNNVLNTLTVNGKVYTVPTTTTEGTTSNNITIKNTGTNITVTAATNSAGDTEYTINATDTTYTLVENAVNSNGVVKEYKLKNDDTGAFSDVIIRDTDTDTKYSIESSASSTPGTTNYIFKENNVDLALITDTNTTNSSVDLVYDSATSSLKIDLVDSAGNKVSDTVSIPAGSGGNVVAYTDRYLVGEAITTGEGNEATTTYDGVYHVTSDGELRLNVKNGDQVDQVVIHDLVNKTSFEDLKSKVDGGWIAQVNGQAVKHVAPNDVLNFKNGNNVEIAMDGEHNIVINAIDTNTITDIVAGSNVSLDDANPAVDPQTGRKTYTINADNNYVNAGSFGYESNGSGKLVLTRKGLNEVVEITGLKNTFVDDVTLNGNVLTFNYNDSSNPETVDLSGLVSSLGTMNKWQAKVGSASFEVSNNEYVEYEAGKNVDLVLNAQNQKITVATKNEVVFDRVAVGGANGFPQVVIDNAGIDMNNQKLTGLADGINNDDAVNLKQLKESRTELVEGSNVDITSVTGNGGNTVYTINATDTKYTVSTKTEGVANGVKAEYTIKENGTNPIATIVDTDTDTDTKTLLVAGGDIQLTRSDTSNTITYTVTANDTTLNDDTAVYNNTDKSFTITDSSNHTTKLVDVARASDLQTVATNVQNNTTNISNILNGSKVKIGVDTTDSQRTIALFTNGSKSSGVTVSSAVGQGGQDSTITFTSGGSSFNVDAGSTVIVEPKNNTDKSNVMHSIIVNGNRYYVEDTTLDINTSNSLTTNIELGNKVIGKNYVVADTAGKKVYINDVASASALQEVIEDVTEGANSITNVVNKILNGDSQKGDLFKISTSADGKINLINTHTGNASSVVVKESGGTEGLDRKIEFESIDGSKFSVTTGSIVSATTNNGVLTGLTINDEDYNLVHTENIAYVNNLAVNGGAGRTQYKTHDAMPNERHGWQIKDTSQPNITFKDTTLDSGDAVSTSAASGYGYNYTVYDTAGNGAVLKDVASANKLQTVANAVSTNTTNIGNLTVKVNKNTADIKDVYDGEVVKINVAGTNNQGKINLVTNGGVTSEIDVRSAVGIGGNDATLTFSGEGSNEFVVDVGSTVRVEHDQGSNVAKGITVNDVRYTIVDTKLKNDTATRTTNDSGITYKYKITDSSGRYTYLDDVASGTALKNVIEDVQDNADSITNIIGGSLMKIGVDTTGDNKRIALYANGGVKSDVDVSSSVGSDGKDATLTFSSEEGQFSVNVGSTVVVDVKDTRNNKNVMHGITVNGDYFVVEDTQLDTTKSGITSVKTDSAGEAYGRDYTIFDTSGNTVEIEDIASAAYVNSSVQNINSKINNLTNELEAEAAKKVIVKNNDSNIKVVSSVDATTGDVTHELSLAANVKVTQSITVGDNIVLNSDYGRIKANTLTVGKSVKVGDVLVTPEEIIGLNNTEWDPSLTYNKGRAATEEQLLVAVNEVKNSAASDYESIRSDDIDKIVVSSSDATVGLVRKSGAEVAGDLLFTSGGGSYNPTGGSNEYPDTFITISNESGRITLNTGSKVVANVPNSGTAGTVTKLNTLEINGRVYTIPSLELDANGNTVFQDYHLHNGNEYLGLDKNNNQVKGYKVDETGIVEMKVLDKHDESKFYSVVSIGNIASKSSLDELGERVVGVETDVKNIKADIEVVKGNIAGESIKDGVANGDGTITLNKYGGGTAKITGLENHALVEHTSKDQAFKVDKDGVVELVTEDMYDSNSKHSTYIADVASATVVGATSKDVLQEKYEKTNYLKAVETEAGEKDVTESLVEADVKLDAAIQANAERDYNNDVILQEQIQNQSQYLDSRINQLGSKVNKVGAGAAALAALHPMDFDPDDKLSFAVGAGNYAGETATALGAFYRPNEKVMMNVAGTYGNGENMVNVGMSFALDRTNNVSNSRTAMAKEIVDLREQVATQGQQIAQLVALVQQLAGVQQPVVPAEQLFPDVPENHWAYEYVNTLVSKGIIEGYPDGTFGGDRTMTRYEFAAMLFRAMEQGVVLSEQIRQEFEKELGRVRVDRVKGADNDPNKIERVRVNKAADRDNYGSKIVQVKH